MALPAHKAHKLEARNEKHGSSSASHASASPSLAHIVQGQSDNKNIGGGASIGLDQIFGKGANGAVKVNGDIGFVHTSVSSSEHTVMTTGSRPSHSHSSSHHPTHSASHSSSHKHSPSHSSKHSSKHTSHAHSSKHHSHSSHHHHKSKHHGHSSHSSKHTSTHKSSHSSATPTSTHNFQVTSSSSTKSKTSKNLGGFYRIGLEKGSKAQRIQSSSNDNDDSSTSGGRVAAVESAKEPGGNLPNQSVTTNNPDYGFIEAQNDLYAIRKWAGDLKMLKSKSDRNETLMALFNAASRYYPDVDTKVVVRVMLADIKAESDFETSNSSPGRIDSGNSLGLVQVSPSGASNELNEFKNAVIVDANRYSWTIGRGTSSEVKSGGESVLGPLLDIKTGKKLDLDGLSKSDLDRPWINLHVAMWLQSNYARTGSQDPSTWNKVAKASKSVRSAYQPALEEILGSSSSSNSSNSFSQSSYSSKLSSLKSSLKGKNHQKTTMATGLGSWVAGAAVDSGGYQTSGDDISSQYFNHIAEGLSVMYTGSTKQKSKYGKEWLDNIELTPGLIDYNQ
ncbi:hypothetical protein MBRA1_003034 [Malassezia brasiliensis]|uniref:Uncharacterized protein n=1 Tax=Malassezia brasiliensis TaxID=1821822 RepID=A0AAF0IPM1_9BASI|nr:hypothetical protein MBRA1_003034 [Malassezia brasiliensis]